MTNGDHIGLQRRLEIDRETEQRNSLSLLLPPRPHTPPCVPVSSVFKLLSSSVRKPPSRSILTSVLRIPRLAPESTLETQFDRGQGDITVSSRLPSSTTMAPGEPTSPVRPPAPPIIRPMPHIHRHDVDGLFDNAKDEGLRFARDIEQKIVGPMPADLFLETFFPHRTRVPHFEDVTFSGIPDKPDRESAIYSPLVSSVVPSSSHPLHFPPRRMN